jgi:hypothetical protein
MFTENSKARGRLDLVLGSLVLALLGHGCFTSPNKVDVATHQCQVADDCPAGYVCKYPGRVGGCCKPADQTCDVGVDGSQLESNAPVDGQTVEGGPIEGSSDFDGGVRAGNDAPDTVDMGPDVGTGAGGTAGLDVPQGSGGSSGSDGGRDAPIDVPILPPQDSGTDGTGGTNGTCISDKDCPTQTPLCLANKCAKCTADTDCSGRTGPACETTSGLCVACTADKYCTSAAAKCNTTTNQCTGCLTRSDCSGTCRACTSGVCTLVKNQDDPGVCAGTCDASGACKAKQGQACSTSTDCVGGICADGYCCNSLCNNSCEACNITQALGTCTALSAGATPRSGHPPCTSSDSRCPSSCQGSSTCTPSTSTCGQTSCSSDHLSYQVTGTCSNGTCNTPPLAACAPGKYCPGSAGTCALQTDGSCQNNYECRSNNCTGGICCSPGWTGCSGTCADVSIDPAHCGGCGFACDSTTQACNNGSCKLLDYQACTNDSQCSNNNCSPATIGATNGFCCPAGTSYCEGTCITGAC